MAADQYLAFTDREAWREWLEANHATQKEAWILQSKKGSAKIYISYEEAVEEALCFGWIDVTLSPVDQDTFALRYSPRKPHSIWSVSNQKRVEKLIAEGRMTAAGLAKIAEAKANGEWEATIARENVDAIPEDLRVALENAGVVTNFKNWPGSRKKQYLYWLSSAKRLETRQKRIRAIVEMANQGNEGKVKHESTS